MNHRLKYESDVSSQELVLKFESCKVLQEIVPYEFLSTPTEKFFSGTSFQSRCVSHMKVANVHEGTIYRNVRIAFNFHIAIFISVCNSHFLVYGSYADICILHMGLQFSYYEFAIFISLRTRLHTFHVSHGYPGRDKERLKLSKTDYHCC